MRRRETVLKRSAGVRFGQRVTIAGQLANRDGQGVPGADVQVFSRSLTSPEQLVAVVQTDAQGRFRYTATGTMSRTLRFAYAGSPLILPAQAEVKLRVPAASSLRVSRRRVLNGQAVTFGGRVRSLPTPPGGKLVELQVRLSGRWQTFRTTRTDEPAAGRSATASSGRVAFSASGSGRACRARPATRSSRGVEVAHRSREGALMDRTYGAAQPSDVRKGQ